MKRQAPLTIALIGLTSLAATADCARAGNEATSTVSTTGSAVADSLMPGDMPSVSAGGLTAIRQGVAGAGESVAVGSAIRGAVAPKAADAQGLSPVDYYRLRQKADEYLHEFEYEKALDAYKQLAEVCPADGENWVRLARCQARFDDRQGAIASYRKALELGFGSPYTHAYQMARLSLEDQNREESLRWLQAVLDFRHEERSLVGKDRRFAPLADDERFQKIAITPPNGEMSRKERWLFDLNVLRDETARLHLGHDREAMPPEFTKALDDLAARIDDLSDAQMRVEIQKAVVLLGDGHTHCQMVAPSSEPQRLPFWFYVFSDGVYVTDAGDEYKDLIGARIVKVNQTPVAEVFARLGSIVSRDNPMGIVWIGPAYLASPAALVGLGLIDDPSRVPMTVVDASGQTREVELHVARYQGARGLMPPKALGDASPPPVPLYFQHLDKDYWFEPLEGTDAVYLQFNVVGNQKGESLREFGLRLRKHLAENKTKNLIVDLRHNGGGNTFLYMDLLRTLIHFDTDNPDNRIYVLIGRNTYSAAMNFTTDVDRLTDAIFVGEPTGGRPNSLGESTRVILPCNNVGLAISSRWHQHSYPTDFRIWIVPDMPVDLSSRDYFSGRDPGLEAVVELMKSPDVGRPPAPSS